MEFQKKTFTQTADSLRQLLSKKHWVWCRGEGNITSKLWSCPDGSQNHTKQTVCYIQHSMDWEAYFMTKLSFLLWRMCQSEIKALKNPKLFSTEMDTAIVMQMRPFTVSCIWVTSNHFEESTILAVAVYVTLVCMVYGNRLNKQVWTLAAV